MRDGICYSCEYRNKDKNKKYIDKIYCNAHKRLIYPSYRDCIEFKYRRTFMERLLKKEPCGRYRLGLEEFKPLVPQVIGLMQELASEYELESHYSCGGKHVSPSTLYHDGYIAVDAENSNGDNESRYFRYLLNITPQVMTGWGEVNAQQEVLGRSYIDIRVMVDKFYRGHIGYAGCHGSVDFTYSNTYGNIRHDFIKILALRSRELLSSGYKLQTKLKKRW